MSSTTKIIDLVELRSDDGFPAYAAIRPGQDASPFVLSPAAMSWRDDLLLVRLVDCREFWLNQKKKLRVKLSELFDSLLQHHYGDDTVAVFGDHPWQCLLYLQYQLQHQGRGLYLLQSRLDRNIYQRIGWDCWFELQSQLETHLLAINASGFKPEKLHARQAQLRRFVDRIGVTSPFAMDDADANAITRRFGAWLGRIWQWTHARDGELNRFPWIPYAEPPLPSVKRDLDYPVNDWACIEVLLREDFTRLCDQLQRDDGEHINRMSWRITLFNDQRITVELSFRHPYSLHRDQPEFATALYQARYIYDDLIRRLQTRDTDLDLPDTMPFVGWQLEINERILLTPLLWDLFAADFEQIDYQQIRALQNKLPVAFECYQALPSFYPEHAFRSTGMGQQPESVQDHYSWTCAASNKPLFYYPQAQAFDPPTGARRIFLERSSRQWWVSGDLLQSIRDYFILLDERGRSSWVYRDYDGSWFKHGEFI